MKFRAIAFLMVAVFSSVILSAQTVSVKKLTHIPKLTRGISFPYKGSLYSIYGNGALYKIDLATGNYTQLGTTLFANAKFLFALNNHVFIIEKDGSMSQVDPNDGAWRVVSPIGTWSTIENVLVVGNNFYTIENGALYQNQGMSDRGRKQIGGGDFFELGIVVYTDTSLYSIVSGVLYQINTYTGKWTKIGSGKNYKAARSAGFMNNRIYTLETPAVLFETSLADAAKKQVDDSHFTNNRGMFSHGNKLYFYNSDDDLCEILFE
jgi:hypothetical protein